MNTDLQLFPESASTISDRIDTLYLTLVSITVFFTVVIAILVIYFAVKYRKGNNVDRTPPAASFWIEAMWIGIPLVILMGIFLWGAVLFFDVQRPPANAMQVGVVGQQWMWKFQHPQGRRETDDLHVPMGQPVQLTMISQDVIHSFFVPAFRVKQDVLPGRYTTLWFEATKPGEYHLFCAEYCGTNHSRMIGKIIVMTPANYQAWLSGGASSEPAHVTGQKLFEQYRCGSCHRGEGEPQARGPSLQNLYGSQVTLRGGETVIADETYIRESVFEPNAKVVAGFQPIMPTFKGQISEEGILQIIAYIKSMSGQEGSQQ